MYGPCQVPSEASVIRVKGGRQPGQGLSNGLFLSSFSNGKRFTVGEAFTWEPLELAAFGNIKRDFV
jgi:hypothetical protein